MATPLHPSGGVYLQPSSDDGQAFVAFTHIFGHPVVQIQANAAIIDLTRAQMD
jgi:hypothetical protein